MFGTNIAAMPRTAGRRVPTVLVPGLDGSGPDHWQSWLAGELVAAGRVAQITDLPDVSHPHLDPWLKAIADQLADFDDNGFDLVAHSLGAVSWMHFCTRDFGVPKPARVALVSAPAPDLSVPECEEFFPVPLDIDGLRKGANGTVLVGSDNDPFCPQGVARTYGTPLKMAATVIPGGAHLNVASGHGPWPAMLDWCRRDNLAFIA
jgi:predicted alpha/beta hydrolase family esterase